MAGHVIVGHVTDQNAKLWVKGSSRLVEAAVTLDDGKRGAASLSRDHDYTAVIEFAHLQPATDYVATVRFSGGLGWWRSSEVKATFSTTPRPLTGAPPGAEPAQPFSFLLGSCNLSVVALNHLTAQALQVLGFHVAKRSLERLQPERRKSVTPNICLSEQILRWAARTRLARWLARLSVRWTLPVVFMQTGGKWPTQPLLRSPFLKLEALFYGTKVHFVDGQHRPIVGQKLRGAKSGATGILAFAPVVETGTWLPHDDSDEPVPIGGQATEAPAHDAESTTAHTEQAKGIMILVHQQGQFEPPEHLIQEAVEPGTDRSSASKEIALLQDAEPFVSGYRKPAFTIHAGDQIYYDFPRVDRAPDVEMYRGAYEEAWFEDRYQRSFLARGNHYMMLDDHEIVDQFSLDRKMLAADKIKDGLQPGHYSAEAYLDHAMTAYANYVQGRHPGGRNHDRPCNANHYTFEYGMARFFVMDTRTRRKRFNDTCMIDADQMGALKDWLASPTHASAVKFIVSSVPFVAEVLGERDPTGQRAAEVEAMSSRDSGSRSDDKWSAAAFRLQRDEIIDWIDQNTINRVVFLVGDMHCAYHASMAIGDGGRWSRRRIHELAGGPIHQLDYGRRQHFATACRKVTRKKKVPYDIRLHQFHGGANAVMHIEVGERDEVVDASDAVPRTERLLDVTWRVIRTMTDPEPRRDRLLEPGRPPVVLTIQDRSPIAGRITFRAASP